MEGVKERKRVEEMKGEGGHGGGEGGRWRE